jgi:predicted alpha/beta superfamily hydrolase/Flp pilus assembly protein TadD
MNTPFTHKSLAMFANDVARKFVRLIKNFALLPMLLLSQFVFASDITSNEVPQVKVNLGKEIAFYSENLKEQREFFIRLPENYEKTKRNYPVIYLLDANNEILTYMKDLYFNSVIGIERLIQHGDIPESIIVGVPFNKDQWFSNVSSNPKPFRNYLTKELSSYINDNYRTINNNILIGQSYSATFVINTLPKSSDTFNSYIAIEPILPSNAYESAVKNYQDISIKNSDLQIILGGDVMLPETEALRKQITRSAGKMVNISLDVFPREDHGSVYYPALNLGLRHHFADYRKPNKDQILSSDFDHQALLNFFEKRAEKYQIETSDKQFQDALFLTIYHQLIAKKFDQAFALWPVWISPNKVYNANRAISHFQRNNDNASAILLLQHLAVAMPNSVSTLDRLATLYHQNKQLDKASKYRLKVQQLLTDIFSKVVTPQQERSLNTYGYSLLNEKRNHEAVAVFKRITQTRSDSINAYDSLADAYEATKNNPEAIKALERAIVLANNKDNVSTASFQQRLNQLKKIDNEG